MKHSGWILNIWRRKEDLKFILDLKVSLGPFTEWCPRKTSSTTTRPCSSQLLFNLICLSTARNSLQTSHNRLQLCWLLDPPMGSNSRWPLLPASRALMRTPVSPLPTTKTFRRISKGHPSNWPWRKDVLPAMWNRLRDGRIRRHTTNKNPSSEMWNLVKFWKWILVILPWAKMRKKNERDFIVIHPVTRRILPQTCRLRCKSEQCGRVQNKARTWWLVKQVTREFLEMFDTELLKYPLSYSAWIRLSFHSYFVPQTQHTTYEYIRTISKNRKETIRVLKPTTPQTQDWLTIRLALELISTY